MSKIGFSGALAAFVTMSMGAFLLGSVQNHSAAASSIHDRVVTEDQSRRHLGELLFADSMSVEEFAFVYQHLLGPDQFVFVPEGMLVEVVYRDVGYLMVIGEAVLADGSTRLFPASVNDGEVVAKGLFHNAGASDVGLRMIDDAGQVRMEFDLRPGATMMSGHFSPSNSATCGGCEGNEVPCCTRDPSTPTQVDCNCVDPASIGPEGCQAGGVGSSTCWISPTGCWVKCQPGFRSCCWTDPDTGRSECHCLGPGDPCVGSGGGKCCGIDSPPTDCD